MSHSAEPGARNLTIEIDRTFHASAERVFLRWTEPDALARWFAPPGYTTVSAEADARPGGRWRLVFEAGDGAHSYTETGVFQTVSPFSQVVMTLTQIDGDHRNPETLITVDLDDVGSPEAPRSVMRFVRRGYRSPALRDDNENGWLGCFRTLSDVLGRIPLRGR